MKLMIVDDNAGMRQSIRQAVAAPGDVVCECASGDEAVRTALQFKPDAVTMDVRMPGTSGFDAARAILTAQASVRIVMVTNYDQPGLHGAATEIGALGVVLKENLEQVRALLISSFAGENKSDVDAEVRAAARVASGSVLRVLMVDDSLADCELIKHHLKSCGYTPLVERVACEETMRHALGWGPWDIVFTDHALPRFSGLDALALLRKMKSQIPALSITGNADPKITEQMLEAGADACISKDDLSTLCDAVEDALSASSSRRATQDLIEQKEAQRAQADLETQLRQAQKLEALGTFAAGIAHDFNNLLTVIIAYTELACDEADKPEQTRCHLDEVRKASEHAQSLVQQLLTFSRQRKQERKPIRLQSVVQEALRFLRSTLPATVEITSKIDAAAPVVLADPTQIHQVIMNLCTNSAHAMRGQSGHLSVTLRSCEVDQHLAESLHRLRPGNYVRLTVSDTGHGMDAATLKHIYEPFFTTKDPGEGTGLGLSVVHGIIREHEGVIAVESQPETGNYFRHLFPGTLNRSRRNRGSSRSSPVWPRRTHFGCGRRPGDLRPDGNPSQTARIPHDGAHESRGGAVAVQQESRRVCPRHHQSEDASDDWA
jgi:signal transduction histidine kinase